MKKHLAAALIFLTVLCLPAQVLAHVLVTDTSGSYGMIVHVRPDDDPVAGEPAYFYFDLADAGIRVEDYVLELKIAKEDGNIAVVKVEPAGPNGAAARYVFPVQGLYRLELTAASLESGAEITFRFNQLIGRGIASSPLDQPRYAWAEFLLVMSLAALGILVLAVIMRRKAIAAYSKQL